MRVGGHRVREHLLLLKPLFIFIALVWLIRLILGSLGAPLAVSKIFTVTGAAAATIFWAAWLIHSRRFGGYTNVVVASLLLTAWGQILVIAAIVFSILTSTQNVFTQPEFSMRGDDPLHLHHIYGHLTFGIGLGTLFGAGMGCLLFWILRELVPNAPQRSGNENNLI